MDSIKLYLAAAPIFIGAILLEACYYRFALGRPYGWWITASNLAVALGRLASEALSKGLMLAVYVWAYEGRLFDIPMDRWETWVALALAVDFAYYWLHRYSHQIRWMWALHSVHHSARQITLSVAYFIPLGRVLRELLKARKRGVRVRVIVPGQSDVKLVQWAARHFYEYLLKRGIRIYESKDRMLHGKAMVIDGQWSMIGSCNIDARSLRLNLEFFAIVHSASLGQALLEICREDIRDSVRVNAAYCRGRSRWQRLVDRAAWAFRKWL